MKSSSTHQPKRSCEPDAETLAQSAIKASQRERDAWRLAKPAADEIPPGYRTARSWAKIWGKERRTALVALKKLCVLGKFEMGVFMVMLPTGKMRPVPHYKLV